MLALLQTFNFFLFILSTFGTIISLLGWFCSLLCIVVFETMCFNNILLMRFLVGGNNKLLFASTSKLFALANKILAQTTYSLS